MPFLILKFAVDCWLVVSCRGREVRGAAAALEEMAEKRVIAEEERIKFGNLPSFQCRNRGSKVTRGKP